MRGWIAGVALVGCGAPVPRAHPPPSTPPNVLIVVLDDVGTDLLGAYAEHDQAAVTPTLDALAADGVLFRNAYANPICGPSRAALLTGRHGRRTGHGENIPPASAVQLALDEVTLPERLAAADPPWSSAAIGKWHLAGGTSPDPYGHPLDQGFGSHRGPLMNLGFATLPRLADAGFYAWERSVDGVPAVEAGYATTVQVDDAIEAAASLSEPWLLYFAPSAPHDPYHVPPSHLLTAPLPDDPQIPDLVRAALGALDTELDRLLASLPAEVRDRTVLLVVGDNGTTDAARLPPSARGEGKLTVFEGGVNVPLIVSGPVVTAPGTETDALVHVVDVFPTVAELAGIDPSGPAGRDHRAIDGVSFLPVLTDPTAPSPRATVFVERTGPIGPAPWDHERVAVRDARFKYMEVLLDGEAPLTALFDLQDRDDDGPNLLDGPLDAVQDAELVALRAALQAQRALPFEGAAE